jgi:RarD protein
MCRRSKCWLTGCCGAWCSAPRFVSLSRSWPAVKAALGNARTLRALALTAALVSANWLIYIWAVVNDQVMATSLGYYINPLVNVLLGMLFLGERLGRGRTLAVVLAAVGTASLALELGGLPWISLSLAFSFGFYGLIRKRLGLPAMAALFVETLLLAPLALLALAWFGLQGQASFGTDLRTSLVLVLAGPVTLLPLLMVRGSCAQAALDHGRILSVPCTDVDLPVGRPGLRRSVHRGLGRDFRADLERTGGVHDRQPENPGTPATAGGRGEPQVSAATRLGPGLLVAGAALLIAWWLWRRRRPSLDYPAAHRLGALEDVVIPDDVDGEIHLDLALLTPRGILVLEVHHGSGTLFWGDQLDQWTVLDGARRKTLKNPLPGLQARRHAVHALVPRVPVDGRVLLAGDVSIAGSAPPGVLLQEDLVTEFPHADASPPSALREAWATLSAAATAGLKRPAPTPPRPPLAAEVVRQHPRDARGDALAFLDVQELVRPVRVRVGPEHAGDEELDPGELLAQHAHERDAAAGAHVEGRLAEEGLRGRLHRGLEPGATGGAFQPPMAESTSNETSRPAAGRFPAAFSPRPPPLRDPRRAAGGTTA